MKSNIIFSRGSDEWATPNDFYNKLNEEFNFNLDHCSDRECVINTSQNIHKIFS